MNLIIDPKYTEQTWSDPDVAEIFNKIVKPEVEREKADYMKRQLPRAKRMREQGSVITAEMGQKIGEVDAIVYHRWGQMLGYQCWGDPGFVKQFLAANPECAAPTLSRRKR